MTNAKDMRDIQLALMGWFKSQDISCSKGSAAMIDLIGSSAAIPWSCLENAVSRKKRGGCIDDRQGKTTEGQAYRDQTTADDYGVAQFPRRNYQDA